MCLKCRTELDLLYFFPQYIAAYLRSWVFAIYWKRSRNPVWKILSFKEVCLSRMSMKSIPKKLYWIFFILNLSLISKSWFFNKSDIPSYSQKQWNKLTEILTWKKPLDNCIIVVQIKGDGSYQKGGWQIFKIVYLKKKNVSTAM